MELVLAPSVCINADDSLRLYIYIGRKRPSKTPPNYQGKAARVNPSSPGTTQSRKTALCHSNFDFQTKGIIRLQVRSEKDGERREVKKTTTKQEEQKYAIRAGFKFQDNPAQMQFPVTQVGRQAPPAALFISPKYEAGSLGVLGGQLLTASHLPR